jgi:hypothetical protein
MVRLFLHGPLTLVTPPQEPTTQLKFGTSAGGLRRLSLIAEVENAAGKN